MYEFFKLFSKQIFVRQKSLCHPASLIEHNLFATVTLCQTEQFTLYEKF